MLSTWILAGIVLSPTGHYCSTTPVHLVEDELDPVQAADLSGAVTR